MDVLRAIACAALACAAGCQIIGGFEDHELLVDAAVTATGAGGGGGDASSSSGGSSSAGGGSSSAGGGSSSAGGSASCGPGETSCDGSCVDTTSDPAHCGRCGAPCGPSAACIDRACQDTCDNCGFEDGSFAGWTTQDVADPYEPLAVVGAGVGVDNLSNQTAPSEGTKALLTGFDGSAGTIEVGQDVTLRPGTTPELQFDYRGAWDMTYGATMPRTFEVRIEPAGGGSPVSQTTILTALPDRIEDTGDSIGTVPLQMHAGDTIFVRFVWTVPRDSTGPAFFQLDDVRIVEP